MEHDPGVGQWSAVWPTVYDPARSHRALREEIAVGTAQQAGEGEGATE